MYFFQSQAPVFAQLHSQDYLVRVAPRMLWEIVFDHVCTVQDPAVLEDNAMASIDSRRTGYTEWQASWDGRTVSLGWDWVERADGDMLRAGAVAPRSNIRLIDPRGYDYRLDDELPAVCARIDSLAWQTKSRLALDADSHGLPMVIQVPYVIQ